MLHILFLILKIIGIILLIILGIAITLICVVLFVPVRYQVKIETTDGVNDLRVNAKATWFLHLISAFAVYQEKKLDWQVRIVWKKIKPDGEEPAKEKSVDKKQEVVEQAEDSVEKKSTVNKSASEKTEKRTTEKEAPKQKPNLIEKIKCTIRRICDKIKAVWEMKEKVVEFLTDEIHLKAFGRLKKELFLIAKRIKPTKLNGFVRFGLEDPYNTGRVLAILSALYPFYGEHIQIYPEFEKEILEGDLFIKGRINVISFVITVCNLYFDKNIKVAYKKLKSLKV